jgi:hypothetical protein
MSVEAARIKITVETNADSATRKLSGLESKTKQSSSTFKNFAKNFLGPAGIAAAVTAAAVALVKFGAASAKAAADAEETFAKFRTVFQEVPIEAANAVNDLADSYDLAGSTAARLLGNTGDLLTGFGLTADAALELSDQTTRLAIDLASFTNAAGGAEAVSSALTRAYSGERDALKSYGIVITEAAVQAQVLKQRQQGLTFSTEQQAKAQATLTLALEQSQNAIGDYERTSDSAVNTQRRLQQEVIRLKENFGEFVLQGLTPVRGALAAYIGALNDARDATKNVEGAVEGLQDGSVDYEAAIENINTGLDQLRVQIRAAYAEGNTVLAIALLDRQRELNAELVIAQANYATYQQSVKEAADAQAELTAQQEAAAAAEDDRIQRLAEQEALLEAQIEAEQNLEQIRINGLLENYQTVDDRAEQSRLNRALAAQALRDAEIQAAEEAALAKIALDQKIEDSALQLFSTIGDLISQNIDDEKKAFQVKKAFNIVEATINTAREVTEVLSNPFLAALVAANGAAQIALIASAQPPGAQFGGSFVVPPGNESDSGLVRVNQGERVDVTPVRGSGTGGPMQINLMLDGRVLARATVDAINSGNGGKIRGRLVD